MYEEGALILLCPPRILPEISSKKFFRNFVVRILYSDGKKKQKYVLKCIAGIIAIEPGRRYTLSIYSTISITTTPNACSSSKILPELPV